jgi:DNA-binding HxlR family transcriptional regulator
MRLLGGRWRLLIASYLLEGPRRFSDLRRCIPAISQRMLTLDLRALEEAGLVQRTVFATVPVTVAYELTSDGARLGPVIEVMRTFGLWLKGREADGSLPRTATDIGSAQENSAQTMIQSGVRSHGRATS